MAKLTVVCGLPGSGKSRLLGSMRLENPALAVVAEDYMLKSKDNRTEMNFSRYFDALVHALRGGSDCVIADIEFVKAVKRSELQRVVSGALQGTSVFWHWLAYERDPVQCVVNICRDVDLNDRVQLKRAAERIEKVGKLLPEFSIQVGAEVRPVWRP